MPQLRREFVPACQVPDRTIAGRCFPQRSTRSSNAAHTTGKIRAAKDLVAITIERIPMRAIPTVEKCCQKD